MENERERADAERDGRACLSRTNSQARTGTGKTYFPVQLTTSRIGNFYPVIPFFARGGDDTYIDITVYTNDNDGMEAEEEEGHSIGLLIDLLMEFALEERKENFR